MSAGMTTDLPHGTPIVHSNCPDWPCVKPDHTDCVHTCPHGIGTVVRTIGNTYVEAQWQGVPLVCREHRDAVTRYIPPAVPVQRTWRRSA